MSALVRNHPAVHDVPARPASEAWTFGGFGLDADKIGAADRFGGAVLTILLVLYPAIASVAVVIAAIVLGNGSV
jgi:hypothetical protein